MLQNLRRRKWGPHAISTRPIQGGLAPAPPASVSLRCGARGRSACPPCDPAKNLKYRDNLRKRSAKSPSQSPTMCELGRAWEEIVSNQAPTSAALHDELRQACAFV